MQLDCRSEGRCMTPASKYAIQSARLLCHLLENTPHAGPEAAAALFTAARALAVDILAHVETAEREVNHAA